MLRAMAKQAEAERERRAKIIHAEGEFDAARKLVDAAALMATEPMTLQLRYLQTLTEIGVEKNTTIVFPLPMELMNLLNRTFAQSSVQSHSGPATTARTPVEPPAAPPAL
jgi:regulator of protease activity HflC (stomatin/prohibitin superfamily)